MLARDVRALRDRRKALQEELTSVWGMQSEAMAQRQKAESLRDRLDWSIKVAKMSGEEIAQTRNALTQQIEAAKKARAQAQQSLQARQERMANRAAQADGEVDVEVLAKMKPLVTSATRSQRPSRSARRPA